MLVTLDDADAYFHTRPASEKWFEKNGADRLKYLTLANRHINGLPFIGERVSPDQEDAFPRFIFVHFPDAIQEIAYNRIDTPKEIKEAVYEEAYAVMLYFESDTYRFKEMGYTRTNQDGVAVEFSGKNRLLLSDEAMLLVKDWVVSSVVI